jgi:hypothetical protein
MRLLVDIMPAESFIKNIFVRINFPGPSFLLLLYTAMLLPACAKIEIFEKNAVIPKHLWQYDLKPQFEFDVTDTGFEVQPLSRYCDIQTHTVITTSG